MVPDVKCDEIQWPVIGVRLVAFFEHVVLGYKMPSDGVETHREQGAHNKVRQNFTA